MPLSTLSGSSVLCDPPENVPPTLHLHLLLGLIGQRSHRVRIHPRPGLPLVQVGPWQTERLAQRQPIHSLVGNRRQEHILAHGEQVAQYGAVRVQRPRLRCQQVGQRSEAQTGRAGQ